MKDFRNIKELLVIPPSKKEETFIQEGNPEELPEGYTAIDLALLKLMKQVTTVPIENTLTPEVLKRRADFLKRHGMVPEYQVIEPRTEKGRDYLDKHKKPVQYRTSITEKELVQAIKKKCAEKAKSQGRVFEWDETTKFMVWNMMLYFGNDDRCCWPIDKGLLLSGNVGVGKTMLLEIFRDISRRYMPAARKNFKMTTCRNVHKSYELVKWKVSKGISLAPDEGLDRYTKGNWCFDDLGNENLELHDFGNKMIVMEDVLLQRANHFAAGRYFTYMSTNLSSSELEERYGARVMDRINQMCTIVEWKGQSRRK